MVGFISTLQRIAPEMVEVVERRYIVLRNVGFMQPVGRRALATRLQTPERAVRNEVDFLRDAGLLAVDAGGMRLTDEGEALLWDLKEVVSEMMGLSNLEIALAERLGLRRVLIAVGDSDVDNAARVEMARVAARYLKEVIRNGDIIAVSGGSTMSEVVNALTPGVLKREVTVLPARGGLGEDVEIQANTIAARMSKVLGGSYRLLHAQDGLSEEAAQTISQEPKVKEVLDSLRQARVVVHGIGLPEEMARRRGVPSEDVRTLRLSGAVGEAFGYYFSAGGQIVFSTSSVGLRLADLAAIDTVVAVGGGASKAQAVLAVINSVYHDVLVTDEGAARAMVAVLGLG